jgi:hypothetical protein
MLELKDLIWIPVFIFYLLLYWKACGILFKNISKGYLIVILIISFFIVTCFYGAVLLLLLLIDWLLGNVFGDDVYINLIPYHLISILIIGIYICYRWDSSSSKLSHPCDYSEDVPSSESAEQNIETDEK